MVAIFIASVASRKLGWVAFAAVATLLVLGDILWDAIERRDLLAVPAIIYAHLPSKCLLPSVTAALILLGVRDLAETQQRAVAENDRVAHRAR